MGPMEYKTKDSMAGRTWSIPRASHVRPFNTMWGRSGGRHTNVVQIRNSLVISPKKGDGKTVPICAKFKCRWAHLVGEGMESTFLECGSDDGLPRD